MMRRSRSRWCALALLTLAGCATSPVTAQRASAEPVLAIRNVRIFDGERVIPEGTVVVRGEKIVAVGADVSPPEGAELVDGQGQTLLPGLVDAHFHADGPDSYQAALALGVTTVIDMFAQLSAHVARVSLEQLPQRGPEEADSIMGLLITAPGGHGTEYPGVTPLTASTPQECEKAVDAAVAAGSRYIKLVYDAGETVLPETVPTLDREVVAACIQAWKSPRLSSSTRDRSAGEPRSNPGSSPAQRTLSIAGPYFPGVVLANFRTVEDDEATNE